MKIDSKEARRIAGLAHLELDDASLDRMAAEMTKILGYIEMLSAVDAAEGTATSASGTPMRDDVMRPSVDRAAVERNAPEWRDGFFVVPAVIEGES
jgi:aspartyl-tRNA(Asn)/glutamyl-tRNA(Gln) amidotransferase subunit C